MHVVLDDVVGEGDLVTARPRIRGTHLVEYRGIPPTGRAIDLFELLLVRFRDGRITEAWQMFDQLELMRQLGLFPRGDPPRPLLRLIVSLQRLRRGRGRG